MGTSDAAGNFRIERDPFAKPADCTVTVNTITRGNGAGACTAFFTVGTVVRLDAQPAADSSFTGFRSLPGCFDASRVTVARGTTIVCQPGFNLR